MFDQKNKIKCVYANGDSFVFGQGLDPDGQNHFYDFTKKLRNENWTGVIATKLGIDLENDYYNDALPGGSNDRIVRTTLSKLPELLEKYKPEEILVLIGWTDSSRTEFCYNISEIEKKYQFLPMLPHCDPNENNSDWTRMKVHKKMHELYYGFFQSTYADYIRIANQLVLLQCFLQKIGVKFLFTASLSLFMYVNSNNQLVYRDFFEETLNLPSLTNLIDKTTFLDSPSVASFLHQQSLTSLPCGHPTSNGHTEWATYIFNYLNLKIL
jgi:hypothetical protein